MEHPRVRDFQTEFYVILSPDPDETIPLYLGQYEGNACIWPKADRNFVWTTDVESALAFEHFTDVLPTLDELCQNKALREAKSWGPGSNVNNRIDLRIQKIRPREWEEPENFS